MIAAPDPIDAAVVVRDLTHRFARGEEGKPVLSSVGFTLGRGEIVILTGPSGSGKTTLLTLIGALRSVQQGSVSVGGQELRGRTLEEMVRIRREIGFIFQTHNLLESLTARQNVKLALEIARKDGADAFGRADEMLVRLGLGERLGYKPDDLSGGQRQRVAVARALVTRPRVVLADEPTAALDAEASRVVVGMLREHAERDGVTVLIVTHDSRILESADRIINVIDGRISSNIAVREALEICDLLRGCPLFASMSPAELTEISQKMVRQVFAPGTPVIRLGETGDRFYIVRQGELDVEVEDHGRSTVTARLGRGDFFGETALMTGEPRNATITARSGAELYSLDKASFTGALAESATFDEQLRSRFFQRGKG